MSIENIKKWLQDAESIKTVKERFNLRTKDTNVDKFKLGFNVDSRFKAFSAEIWFGGYTGTYGNSSVYDFCRINDPSTAKEALIAFCVENEDAILNYISDYITNKARDAASTAKVKAEQDLALLSELEHTVGGGL